MVYGKIIVINDINSFSLLSYVSGFSEWLKRIKSFFVLPILLAVVFVVVNTDVQSLGYSVASYFRTDSIRAMDIPKEWVSKYNIILTDKISIVADDDGDGLTFQQEAQYGTNPFAADTDGDGVNDGEEVKNGSNPLGSGELDTDQDGMPDVWEKQYGLPVNIANADQDPDNDGLTNKEEYLHGTNPVVADTDGDGYSDFAEIRNGYDPNAPGDTQPKVTVLSDKLSVAVPMVWSKSNEQSSLDTDLESGVIRYPASGVPGQNGNVIIAGHSSNYAWAKGGYNSIFKNLNKLEVGDTVIARVIQQNGKTFDYTYTITEKKVLDASNDWIFQDFSNEQVLTLTTCWPIGTDISRLVVRATRETTLL